MMRCLLLFLLLCAPASAIDWSAWESGAAAVPATVPSAPRQVTVGGKGVNLEAFLDEWYAKGRSAGWHNPAGRDIREHLREHGFTPADIEGLDTETMTRLHIAHHAWQQSQVRTQTKTVPVQSQARWVRQRVCNGRGGCSWRWVMVR